MSRSKRVQGCLGPRGLHTCHCERMIGMQRCQHQAARLEDVVGAVGCSSSQSATTTCMQMPVASRVADADTPPHLRRAHPRNMLEELLDDQEDIGDINLSSRPKREERRRQRDREALEREVQPAHLSSMPRVFCA